MYPVPIYYSLEALRDLPIFGDLRTQFPAIFPADWKPTLCEYNRGSFFLIDLEGTSRDFVINLRETVIAYEASIDSSATARIEKQVGVDNINLHDALAAHMAKYISYDNFAAPVYVDHSFCDWLIKNGKCGSKELRPLWSDLYLYRSLDSDRHMLRTHQMNVTPVRFTCAWEEVLMWLEKK